MVKECDYQKATALLSQGKYGEARLIYTGLEEYADAKMLEKECYYQEANLLLDQKEYVAAMTRFQLLGDYCDSKDKAQYAHVESDYQRANHLFANGQYDQAKKLYASLGKYADAPQKLVECNYNIAMKYYSSYTRKEDEHAIKEAMMLFASLGSFKDASSYLQKCQTVFYEKAISQIKRDPGLALTYFALVIDYKDSRQYFSAVGALQMSTDQEQYDALIKLWDFPYAHDLLVNDYVMFFLTGTWRNGDDYFTITYEDSSHTFTCLSNIPRDKAKYGYFMDAVYYSGDTPDLHDRAKKQYAFTFIDQNNMEIYCFKNSRTYSLVRQ